MAKDLTVALEDTPGALAGACAALGSAGINIEGCCAYRTEGEARLHVLVEDAAGARAALEQEGYEAGGERDVLVVQLEDRPGAAGETLRRIAHVPGDGHAARRRRRGPRDGARRPLTRRFEPAPLRAD